MNYNQRFDEHIKDQFTDYEPSVHPRIWENINNQRDKKRPAVFWVNFLNRRNILLASALLLAVSGGGYFFLQKSKGVTMDTNNNVNSIAVKQSTTNLQTPDASNTTTAQQTLTETAGEEGNKDQVSPVDEANNSNISGNKKNTPNTSTNGGGSILSIAQQQTAYSSLQKQKTKNTAARLKIKYNNATVADDESEDAKAYQLTPSFFVADKINTNIAIADALQQRKQKNILLPDCPSIEKNTAGNKTYIEVYGGPDIAFRSFADTANSVYLQKRKESTKFASAFSAGLRYTKVFNNGMSIRTGINYSQINEKFIYSEGNIIQVVYIINATGDTIGSYTTTGTRFKTTHNKFRTIDVPVAVGYEMGNERLHANINAGVMINIYSWQRGEVLDYNLRPVNITTGKSNSPFQFKTNIGLAFIGAASIYYKMNDKLHLLAEPYFRYSLAPASKETTTFKQKYNTAGLRLGLRLDL